MVENLGTWLLAIVLALIVWLIAITEEDPLQTGEFYTEIPVTAQDLPEELQTVQDLESLLITPVLRAPRSSWQELTVGDFLAYVDMSGLEPGTHTLPVYIEVSDPQVKVLNSGTTELEIQLDRVITKTVPIRVEVADSPAFGYEWEQPYFTPVTATVSGPAALAEQVVVAEATMYLRNADSQVERVVGLTPQNARGQFVSGLDIAPRVVRVVVPINPWQGRKEVAVRPNLEGQPAVGYRLGSIEVEPSTIILLGDNEVLNRIPGFVETEPLLLDGATEEISEQLRLMLPEGVTAIGGDTVSVRASVIPIEGGATLKREPEVENLGPNLKSNVALETVDVILRGPLTQLEGLAPDDVHVILDLEGLLPGSHIVRPRIILPEGISLEGVLPETVEVVITSLATPTPPAASPLTTPVTGTNTILPPTPTPP
jgi:YbbR domain-containing protein